MTLRMFNVHDTAYSTLMCKSGFVEERGQLACVRVWGIHPSIQANAFSFHSIAAISRLPSTFHPF